MTHFGQLSSRSIQIRQQCLVIHARDGHRTYIRIPPKTGYFKQASILPPVWFEISCMHTFKLYVKHWTCRHHFHHWLFFYPRSLPYISITVNTSSCLQQPVSIFLAPLLKPFKVWLFVIRLRSVKDVLSPDSRRCGAFDLLSQHLISRLRFILVTSFILLCLTYIVVVWCDDTCVSVHLDERILHEHEINNDKPRVLVKLLVLPWKKLILLQKNELFYKLIIQVLFFPFRLNLILNKRK